MRSGILKMRVTSLEALTNDGISTKRFEIFRSYSNHTVNKKKKRKEENKKRINFNYNRKYLANEHF